MFLPGGAGAMSFRVRLDDEWVRVMVCKTRLLITTDDFSEDVKYGVELGDLSRWGCTDDHFVLEYSSGHHVVFETRDGERRFTTRTGILLVAAVGAAVACRGCNAGPTRFAPIVHRR